MMEPEVHSPLHTSHDKLDIKPVDNVVADEEPARGEFRRFAKGKMDPKERALVRKLDWYIMV